MSARSTRTWSRSTRCRAPCAGMCEVADNALGYAITSAPLAIDGKIVIGVSGGEAGIRGFLDAYDAKTGKRVWRFYTVPGPGEPGHDTWGGESWKTGGAPDLAHRHLRPGAEPALLGRRQPGARLERRRSPGRQPVQLVARRARRGHRRAPLALPVHAARHARLGRQPDSRARRRDRRRAARASWWSPPTATASTTSSTGRRASSCAARAYAKQTWAQRARRARPAPRDSRHRAVGNGHARVAQPAGRHQLVQSRVRRPPPVALRARARDGLDVLQDQGGLRAGQAVHGRRRGRGGRRPRRMALSARSTR